MSCLSHSTNHRRNVDLVAAWLELGCLKRSSTKVFPEKYVSARVEIALSDIPNMVRSKNVYSENYSSETGPFSSRNDARHYS